MNWLHLSQRIVVVVGDTVTGSVMVQPRSGMSPVSDKVPSVWGLHPRLVASYISSVRDIVTTPRHRNFCAEYLCTCVECENVN